MLGVKVASVSPAPWPLEPQAEEPPLLASEAGASAPLERHERVDAAVRAHQALVWRVLRRLGLSPTDADDASQRVFMVLAKRIDTVQPGRERPFLLAAATHIARRAYRSQRRSLEVPEEPDVAERPASDPSPEDIMQQRELCRLLDQVLAELAPKFREVYVLCEIERFTVVEVATLLGIPPGTVASRARVAREHVVATLTRRTAPQAPGRRA